MNQTAVDIQKIIWKAFIADPAAADPDIFFKVFNTWIPDSPEIFIDVADYSHTHDGPVTALVGHHEDYWLDAAEGRMGFLYNRRLPMDGSNEEKLTSSLRSFLFACRKIEQSPDFKGRMKIRTDEFLFMINDRALAPNTAETFAAVKPELHNLFSRLLGDVGFSMEHPSNPRRRFGAKITVSKPQLTETLIQRLR